MDQTVSQISEKVEINMTPMIDVVFQLLIFFMLTMKTVIPEGDFDIRMPLGNAAAGAPDDQLVPPIRVKMTAAADGRLSGLTMNGTPIKDFVELQNKIVSIVGTDTGPNSLAENTEVELDCDYGLDYENVVQAITAVSGRVRDGKIEGLIKKIKFTPLKSDS